MSYDIMFLVLFLFLAWLCCTIATLSHCGNSSKLTCTSQDANVDNSQLVSLTVSPRKLCFVKAQYSCLKFCGFVNFVYCANVVFSFIRYVNFLFRKDPLGHNSQVH